MNTYESHGFIFTARNCSRRDTARISTAMKEHCVFAVVIRRRTLVEGFVYLKRKQTTDEWFCELTNTQPKYARVFALLTDNAQTNETMFRKYSHTLPTYHNWKVELRHGCWTEALTTRQYTFDADTSREQDVCDYLNAIQCIEVLVVRINDRILGYVFAEKDARRAVLTSVGMRRVNHIASDDKAQRAAIEMLLLSGDTRIVMSSSKTTDGGSAVNPPAPVSRAIDAEEHQHQYPEEGETRVVAASDAQRRVLSSTGPVAETELRSISGEAGCFDAPPTSESPEINYYHATPTPRHNTTHLYDCVSDGTLLHPSEIGCFDTPPTSEPPENNYYTTPTSGYHEDHADSSAPLPVDDTTPPDDSESEELVPPWGCVTAVPYCHEDHVAQPPTERVDCAMELSSKDAALHGEACGQTQAMPDTRPIHDAGVHQDRWPVIFANELALMRSLRADAAEDPERQRWLLTSEAMLIAYSLVRGQMARCI